MKAIGIVGSPRKGGNAELYTVHTLKTIAEEGIETELITLAGLEIHPCQACMSCRKEERCAIEDDLQPIYEKMKAADAIIIASPVYFQGPTGLVRAFLERAGYVAMNNGLAFAGKVGGPLVVARRTGHNLTLAQLLLWYASQRMFIPGSINSAFGREKGEVLKDPEGLDNAWSFGKNIALLVKKLQE